MLQNYQNSFWHVLIHILRCSNIYDYVCMNMLYTYLEYVQIFMNMYRYVLQNEVMFFNTFHVSETLLKL